MLRVCLEGEKDDSVKRSSLLGFRVAVIMEKRSSLPAIFLLNAKNLRSEKL